jgi:uncharacterized membrane protein
VKENPTKIALRLAIGAVFAGLVCVATMVFTVSIPATSGYFNLGETVIYVSALLFGPFVGALAGGIGASIADMLVAPQFAIGTLVIKGLEGAIVGFLNKKLFKNASKPNAGSIISIIVGGAEMILGYFVYEQLVLNYPMADALVEIPFNIVQMLVGLIVALIIVKIILLALPQLKNQS